MKNLGFKIALVAILVNAPRFVITFLAADGMQLWPWLEGLMLALTGIATGVVLTGGGAYIAHELIVMRGHVWARVFMALCWVALLIFGVVLLAPLMAAWLENSELATVLDTKQARLWWAVVAVVAVEVLAAGAMVAHAVTESPVKETTIKRGSRWSVVGDALASRLATQLQPTQPAHIDAQLPAHIVHLPAQPVAQSNRERAMQMHNEGLTNAQIAVQLDVHRNTVSKWLKTAEVAA